MTSLAKLEMKKFESRMCELFRSYDAFKEDKDKENRNLDLKEDFYKKLFGLSDYVGSLIVESEKDKYQDLLIRLQDLESKTVEGNLYDVNK